MALSRDGWFEPAKPIRVEGGIKARAKRGSIGEQWWSRRFVDILEDICDSGRLSRGRAYARKGQVLDIDLRPGVVKARVQGSRPRPYQVTITIEAYDEDAWTAIESALAAQALFRAKLLAGEMPPEIEAVFDSVDLPLFPDANSLDMACSCPDWGFPCKHLSAVLYLLAEAFDDDPFLVLAWRGRDRDDLLAAVHRLAGNTTTATVDETDDPLRVDDGPLTDRLTNFYAPAVSLARLRDRPPAVTAPSELLLRALEPPKIKVRHIPLVDLLRPAYRDLGTTAEPPTP